MVKKTRRTEHEYDSILLQKIVERYLLRSILEEDIFGFLRKQKSIPFNRIASLLAEATGKSQNSIYKNINQYTNYSASSLLRYWYALLKICSDNGIPKSELPTFESVIEHHQNLLDFIIQISTETELTDLIETDIDITWTIYEFVQNNQKIFSKSEISKVQTLLSQIVVHPAIKLKLAEKEKLKLERMLKK